MKYPTRSKTGFHLTIIAAMLTTATLAGCSKAKPSGQIVATINGEDVTASELDAELRGAQVPAARDAALQAIIERKLFAKDARDRGLDKDPAYIVERRRGEELLLAQRDAATIARTAQHTPTPSELSAYIESNPTIGRDRRIMIVDQLQFATPATLDQNALQSVSTIAELEQFANARGWQNKRNRVEIDSATLPTTAFRQLMASQSEPVLVVQGPTVFANQLVGMRPVATEAGDVENIARQRLLADQARQALEQRTAALRSSAKIDYAKGYAPTSVQRGGAR